MMTSLSRMFTKIRLCCTKTPLKIPTRSTSITTWCAEAQQLYFCSIQLLLIILFCQIPFEIEFSKDFIEGKAPLIPQAEEEEDVSEVLKPKPAAAEEKPTAAEKPADDQQKVLLDSLQGKWKMVSLGQNGDFSSPTDMTPHNIVFAIDGQKYTVTAGDEVQEQGTVAVDSEQDPPHLDQNVTDGPDSGKTHLGIFRLTDGKLENCQGAFGQPRPSTFESEKDSTASLAVFERA